MGEEPWTEEYNVNALGLFLGHVGPISGIQRKRKKHPFGFGVSGLPRKPRGGRRPGSWPVVPRFDLGGDE